jgi:hypothetical protein
MRLLAGARKIARPAFAKEAAIFLHVTLHAAGYFHASPTLFWRAWACLQVRGYFAVSNTRAKNRTKRPTQEGERLAATLRPTTRRAGFAVSVLKVRFSASRLRRQQASFAQPYAG